MAENKTKKTEVSVDSFLDKVTDETQRADSYTLIELMKAVTGEPPRMWGPSIIGFGDYHYKYASGHEGDCCIVGFSPRKGKLALYVMTCVDEYAAMLAKLGKHKTGKVCVYVKKLADIDLKVLRAMIEKTYTKCSRVTSPEPKNEPPTKQSSKQKARAKA